MTLAATSATTTAAVLSNTNAHHHQKWMRCSDVGMVSLPTSNWEPFATRWRPHTRSPLLVPRAASAETAGKDNKRKKKKRPDEEEDDDGGKDKQEQEQEQQLQQASVSMISLDDVNPVGLGRKSRQIFDEVWRKFSGLGQISRTTRTDEETLLIREGGPMCEFAIPGAQNTTVLVVGATSRIGRIVVRKLMLRGYTVKALVRKADQEVVDMLPRSVEIAIGDVGDPDAVKAAVEGCNKIIYCATARSAITGDLNRVDYQGVYNATKAFQALRN